MNLKYRIERIRVEGYRAFQHDFSLDFPWPAVAGHPDVLVLGSANGVGKTSILEALLWGGLAVTWGSELPSIAAQMEARQRSKRPGFPQIKSLLRTDSGRRQIELATSAPSPGASSDPHADGDARLPAGWRRGAVTLTFAENRLESVAPGITSPAESAAKALARHAMENILRPGIEPVRIPGMLYFSSFRRVYEGNIDPKTHGERAQVGLGLHQFKVSALDLTLWRKDLLIDSPGQDAEMERAYDVLNDLLRSFAGVVLAGKADRVEGHFQPFVQPERGGSSFPLDNLSSGQKEAISTLFLLWKFTDQSPSVVLIDEPELYLNREWHGTFLKRIFKLVPHNQYILATHSKEVASAAPTGTLRMLRSPP